MELSPAPGSTYSSTLEAFGGAPISQESSRSPASGRNIVYVYGREFEVQFLYAS